MLGAREGERGAIARLLDSARAGRGGGLILRGEAGIGKSALLRAVIDGADPRVLIGSCLPLTHSLPLLPLTDILRAAFQLDGGRSLATAGER